MKKELLFRSVIAFFLIVSSLVGNAQSSDRAGINIIDFNVARGQKKVNIKWATDKMSQPNYFEVEKSSDGKNFKTIAYVLGTDPARTDCECYGCFDKISRNSGKSYYRLKHINNEGGIEFSEVKMLVMQ